MFQPITIAMSVYFPQGKDGQKRKQVALDTLYSWQRHLKYAGELHLRICEDGDTEEFLQPAHSVWYQTLMYSGHERGGLGKSLNKGFSRGFEVSPLVAAFMDDWSLTADFDLTPWAQVLLEREDIGVIRLGVPHPNTTGRIEHLGELGWGLILDRYSYAFGHRPALYHERAINHYSWFKEDCSPLECERDYSDRINADPNGPDVMLALPHPWAHLDSISMSSFAPNEI